MDIRHNTRLRILVVAGVVVLLIVAAGRALDRPTRIDYYRVIDPNTLGIETTGGAGSWTRVVGIEETPDRIVVTVSSLTVPFLPRSDSGSFLELPIRLSSPLGSRSVIDGSDQESVGPAPSPWPPQLGP